MKKNNLYIAMLLVLSSAPILCMLINGGKTVLRTSGVVRAAHTLSAKEYCFARKCLSKQRLKLEKECFGHGGLYDLMTLGPDESVQKQYQDNMLKIAPIKKQEKELQQRSNKR